MRHPVYIVRVYFQNPLFVNNLYIATRHFVRCSIFLWMQLPTIFSIDILKSDGKFVFSVRA